MTTKAKDPWDLDVESHQKMQNQMKGVGGSGIFCPKRNIPPSGQPAGDCKVCGVVAKWFNSGIENPDRKLAFMKMAKADFFLNAVIPPDTNKSVILAFGKKAGKQILDGINIKHWVDIANPKAGKGREMECSKSKGDLGYPAYTVTPVLDKAEYDIPDSVIENLPNLDNIIDILKSGSHEIRKVSDMNMGETLRFRICPHWDNGKNNKRVLAIVWRHFGGVTQEEVDGLVPVDDTLPETDRSAKEKKTEDPLGSANLLDSTPPATKPPKSRCFGMKEVFDEEQCKSLKCEDLVGCKQAVEAKLAEDVAF